MHELSLCQALLDQAATIAAQHQASAITSVTVQVGALSGVDTGLLSRAFEVAREGTLARGAVLTIKTGVIVTECTSCGERARPANTRLRCLACGSFHIKIIEGQELLLASLELDVTEDNLVQ